MLEVIATFCFRLIRRFAPMTFHVPNIVTGTFHSLLDWTSSPKAESIGEYAYLSVLEKNLPKQNYLKFMGKAETVPVPF